jgi:tRNA nucleotidyltransferase/poly(A) polymerase
MTPQEVARTDQALAAALPPGSLYAVGGRVRDEIRTRIDGQPRPFKDLDYVVVGLGMEELVARLGAAGTAELVGASFAVVKWHRDGLTADVALPRRERSTGLGHRDFVVDAAGPDVTLEEDLARRDFRMNMIARALPSGDLVDPYAGEADIRAGRIDLLRPEAFEEDPLRMLRAAQFAARFGYALTGATAAEMKRSARLAATVSPERSRDELTKLLLEAPAPSDGFEVLREGGLLDVLFPELIEGVGVEQNRFHRFDVYRHTMAVLDATPPGDLTLRLAALLHDIAKPRCKDGPHFYGHEVQGAAMSEAILERFRFAGETIATVSALVRNHLYLADPDMKEATLRRFIRRVGVERLQLLFALRHADVSGTGFPPQSDDNERFETRVWAMLAQHPPLHVRDLAVDGADAIAALVSAGALPPGSRGGPAVGKLLEAVLEAVLEYPALDRPGQLAILSERAPMFHGERKAGSA